jgi:Domain of Unknown Function with PDB structure (DUF3865)
MIDQTSTAVSDYRTIGNAIAEYTKDHPKDYNECVKGLLGVMTNYFPALRLKSHPIVSNMNFWGPEDLAFVIKEYAGFTNHAIHWFLDVRIRTYWEKVRKEVERNMSEELGVLTQGIPHLELMRQGHREDLEIETDDVTYSGVTQNFIDKMVRVFKHEDNAFASGALLAFEATATEEFKAVDLFLRKRADLIGKEWKKGSLTDVYVAGHVDSEEQTDHPEDSHYQGLQDAIGEYITPQNIHHLVQGFFTVLMHMSIWWEQLATETYYQKALRESLKVQDSQLTNAWTLWQTAAA